LAAVAASRDFSEAAQVILDFRKRCLDAEPSCSLATLYDPLTMPPELVKAHASLDALVDRAYGRAFANDNGRVARLFNLYAAAMKLQWTETRKIPGWSDEWFDFKGIRGNCQIPCGRAEALSRPRRKVPVTVGFRPARARRSASLPCRTDVLQLPRTSAAICGSERFNHRLPQISADRRGVAPYPANAARKRQKPSSTEAAAPSLFGRRASLTKLLKSLTKS